MDKIVSARLDEGAIHQMEQVVRRLGITKKRFLEEAIRLRAQQAGHGGGPDVWAETCGAWRRREAPAQIVAAVRSAFREAFERHHGGGQKNLTQRARKKITGGALR